MLAPLRGAWVLPQSRASLLPALLLSVSGMEWLAWTLPVVAVVGPLAAGAAPATQNQDAAGEAVRLFMQSCVQFPSDRAALQAWIKKAGYPEVPADHADEFLNGLPGAAYDASGGGLSLVIVSQDSGSCSVVADHANGPGLVRELENSLRAANITFTAADDPPDPHTKDLNNREYTVPGQNGGWHMLISTVKDPAGGAALLTTNP
jgi:hypothetical protein